MAQEASSSMCGVRSEFLFSILNGELQRRKHRKGTRLESVRAGRKHFLKIFALSHNLILLYPE